MQLVFHLQHSARSDACLPRIVGLLAAAWLDLPIVERITLLMSFTGKERNMYTLQVEKMSCGHCANAITKAVQAVDAQAKVQVDLAQKKVQIESAASLERVREVIVEAGYPVTAAA